MGKLKIIIMKINLTNKRNLILDKMNKYVKCHPHLFQESDIQEEAQILLKRNYLMKSIKFNTWKK